MAWGIRRVAEHPATRVALLVVAAIQALTGAFVLGLAVNVGTGGLGNRPSTSRELIEAPLPPGPFPLEVVAVLPNVSWVPGALAPAPDGSLWFTLLSKPEDGPVIGRVDTAGRISRYPAPSARDVRGITIGPDGAVWFAEHGAAAIGRLSPSGSVTRHPIGSPGYPRAIATGPDGNLWFTASAPDTGDWIGRMTPAGTVTRFPTPTRRSEPTEIILGADGNLWFSMSGGVGRVTPAGAVTELPTASAFGVPSITAGPDGAIWFAANSTRRDAVVGRVTTDDKPRVTALHLLPNGADLEGITSGADGNLWVAESSLNAIARVTPGGQVTQFTFGPDRFPGLLVAGADGTGWMTVSSPRIDGGLARFTLPR